ncbi:EAL domain-containing protein [Vibrio eleionomae]|nr:cyclic diguanylate phosphodiesterase [Vibrio eleionomae]
MIYEKYSSRQLTAFTVVLLFFIAHIIAYSLITVSSIRSLEEHAKEGSELALNRINSIVESISEQSKSRLYPLAGNCAEFSYAAELYVLTSPYVRSVSVVKDQHISCSTIAGVNGNPYLSVNEQLPIQLNYYAQSPVFIHNASADVVILNIKVSDAHMLFGITPQVLSNFLFTDLEHVHFRLNAVIGGHVLDAKALPKMSGYMDHMGMQDVVSNPYIDIYYSIDGKDFLANLVDPNLSTYLLFTVGTLLLCILLYMFCKDFDWLRLAITEALYKKQFVPYVQPLIDSEKRLVGVEVLARWHHPLLGTIPPNLFISCAEQSGQISSISHMLMDRVIAFFEQYKTSLPEGFHIGFNACAFELNSRQFYEDCSRFVEQLGEHIHLVVEITERQKIPLTPVFLEQLERYQKLGIEIAADDFGTEHSSLVYLKKIDFDYLKIDKQFVDLILSDDLDHAIIDNVIDLKRRINIPAVAEGIETIEQFDYLKDKGVELFQGYHFGRPQPLDDFANEHLNKVKPKENLLVDF